MKLVREHIDVFPFDAPPYVLDRREDLLLADPLPSPMKRAREYPPIEVAHLGAAYVERAFAPPMGVYESADIRIEWQNMNGRQPFYHRNCGVDELSFQVCGERTLITELGTVELRPGDFSRIPNGVAHDNFGRRDIHLLFYVPGPVRELAPVSRRSEYLRTPFPGWAPAVINELTTEGVGGPGQDLALSPVDEALLLQHAEHDAERIHVLHPEGDGLQWLYRGDAVAIGRSRRASDDGAVYTMHRDACEIQVQIQGERTLVTQRGCVHLVPGDFVQIPRGIAFTSLHTGPSEHLALASPLAIPLVAPAVRQGTRLPPEELARLRGA